MAITNINQELQNLVPADLDAGLVFSGSPSGKIVRGFAAPNAFTPKIDPNYLFHDSMRDVAVWFMGPPEPLYMCGPTGSGKTSLIKQVAARLQYPVFEVTGHGRLELVDLVGHLTVRNGNMEMQYGPLALAMKYGGLALLNEIDITDPSTLCGLNSVLDGSPLCIPENEGELIEPHPLFRFACTANSNGASDETGLYQGVMMQNMAFLDRFVFCQVDYPSAEAESNLLAKIVPVLPEKVRDSMIFMANEVRKRFMNEGQGQGMELTFSTRTLIRWADLTVRYQPLARQGIKPIIHALDRALAFRASRETRAALHELAQRIFPAGLGEN